ncbi:MULTISPECIES: iron chelate uptake ABC transporter family permease subunit [Brachybacterium]|uniref:iron chelate uptake ABC transporter family permease subunit n=1 Tax=Brachybacterium TaxID=43668 RepID=UPI0006C71814|nr:MULTISPECIES: iron chelate uptake ABC transporter family permease subunit [Brachybacterium]MDV3294281.1 iron chelate uptake ABC transporter family permease subunit [Brachybacterium paraconglomeratum]TDP79806.1 iron complex transport system permease protein [Brachybacterium sp. AG952]GAP77578.1 petrobactin ABC transporter, permease protein II [Brachybacterium sp. SW0106-09]
MAERTTTHDGRRLEAVADEAAPVELSTAPADAAGELGVLSAPRRVRARSGAFPDAASQRRYWIVLAVLVVLAAGAALGLLAIGNPMPVGSRGFWLIAEMRVTSLVVMAVVAICQAVATITFQTVTNNRIITPSIMGFESLYTVIQTAAVYTLGVAGVVALQGPGQFLAQVAAMVGLSVLLYGWLLRGRYANIQVMLLVGIIMGGGLGAVSTFMQRLLSPSEFDVLSARLFGSVTNASAEYLPFAIPLVIVATTLIWLNARTLNVIAMGRDVCINVGVDHGRQTIYSLVLVSVLMAVSTALVGPMTFFGFLVATLTYQLAGTHDHRRLLPLGALTGFVVLAGAYFVMNHVFYAQGVVSIIIELVGGTVFLVVIMRKGRL